MTDAPKCEPDKIRNMARELNLRRNTGFHLVGSHGRFVAFHGVGL